MRNIGRMIPQMKIGQATTVIIMAEEKSNSHVFIPLSFSPKFAFQEAQKTMTKSDSACEL